MLRLDAFPTVRVRVPSLGLRRLRLPRLAEWSWIVWPAIALYLTVGCLLIFGAHMIVSDAWSRVASAYAVFFSRDPHLAAIGFVWSPVPAFALFPFVALNGFWRPLVTDGYAATIVSALAMGGAVYHVHAMLREWGLNRPLRIVGTLAFALHPMIVFYGANGNTEGLFILFLVIAARYLSRWLDSPSTSSLAIAGLALAGGYLTRYEALAAAMAATAVVVLVSYVRSPGSASNRRWEAAADGFLVATPFVAAFVVWAGASWMITGAPFEQFSSAYGVAAQVEAGLGYFGEADVGNPQLVVAQVLGFQPLAPAVLILSVAVAAWRRDRRWLAPMAIFGGVLAFVVLAWLMGRTGGWVRYYIAVIPLVMALAILSLSPNGRWSRAQTRVKTITFGAVIAVLAVMSSLSSATTLADPWTGRTDLYVPERYQVASNVAEFFDAQDLPDGSVLIDAFAGSPVIARSEHPRQFVITSDRDFLSVVDDPQLHDITYLVVPPPERLTALDAINRAFPDMYETGSGIATFVEEFTSPYGATTWRVYRVNG